MKLFLSLFLSLSFAFCDAQLIANIDHALQKVINESDKKEIKEIKVSYDPFNTNKVKQIQESKFEQERVPQKNRSELALSMIFNKNAFINGKWYKENDKLADYRIIKINQDIVILKKNSKYSTLKLPLSDMVLVTKEEIK